MQVKVTHQGAVPLLRSSDIYPRSRLPPRAMAGGVWVCQPTGKVLLSGAHLVPTSARMVLPVPSSVGPLLGGKAKQGGGLWRIEAVMSQGQRDAQEP